jgi:hypothetical protein
MRKWDLLKAKVLDRLLIIPAGLPSSEQDFGLRVLGSK